VRDAAAVQAAMDESVREAVDSQGSGPRAVFVAEEDGEIVGFATTSTRPASLATSTRTSVNSPSPAGSSVAVSVGG
jgi:hypothetical protein